MFASGSLPPVKEVDSYQAMKCGMRIMICCKLQDACPAWEFKQGLLSVRTSPVGKCGWQGLLQEERVRFLRFCKSSQRV